MSILTCRHALVYLGNEKPTGRQHLRKLQRKLDSWMLWCLCSPVHSIKNPVFTDSHFFSECQVQSSSPLSFYPLLSIPPGTFFCEKILLMVREDINETYLLF